MLLTPPPSPLLGQCAPEDRLGFRLAGRLELTGILGVGAYGVVYTARDIFTGRDYAVKALNKLGLDSRQRRFQQREIQLHHEASSHPNVVSLVKIMDSEDCTYVVLEYCPEGDLFSSITEQCFYVGNDTLVKDAFLQILNAVAYCHSLGIYHRDLKPENILITDGGHTIKVADFGLATRDPITSDFGCGSTFYMSPECQSSAPTSQTCYASAPNDIWSLGVILVNLTCGRNPWKRASVEDTTFRAYLKDPQFLSSILPISSELETLLRRIFECNPAKRISIPELRQLILQCDFFTARPQAPQTPPPEDFQSPVCEPPVVLNPYDNSYEALFTPPPSPPAAEAFAKPTCEALSPVDVMMDSDSDYDSDNDSVFSSASSVSDYDEPIPCLAPQFNAALAQSNFYCIPSADQWKRPMACSNLVPSIQCY
ncbi:hypothetical protein MMC10_002098 [Thelotrema lepadinum]|nr:hypothetical protein [Thelotrema lepadinum]